MSVSDWAKREVEIACKKENPNWNGESFDYGCSCYQSALKAFKSLMEDGHSGYSFSVTANILNRLCNNLPLTPIEDSEDNWELSWENKDGKSYQCDRMSSLFKHVNNDMISYSDVDRVVCYDLDNPSNTWHNGFIDSIVEELFPITFPYYPSVYKYEVGMKEYLSSDGKGDFDTIKVATIKTPNGETKTLDRYFTEMEGKWKEITKEEFDELIKNT